MSRRKEVVATIAKGRMNTIRDILKSDQSEHFEKILAGVIERVAKAYGAREVDQYVLNECVAITKSKFKALGIDEIIQAYRLWAGEEIMPKNGEMWGGTFSVIQYCNVLNAYLGYRKSIVSALIKTEDRLALEYETPAQKNAEVIRRIEEEVIEKFPSMDSWEKIPNHWHSSLVKRGIISDLVGQNLKQTLIPKAMEIAKIQLEKELAEEKERSFSMANVIQKVREHERAYDERLQLRTKAITEKMYVFEELEKRGYKHQSQVEKPVGDFRKPQLDQP